MIDENKFVVITISVIILFSLNQISFAQEIDSLDYFLDDGYEIFIEQDGVKKFYFPYQIKYGEIKEILFPIDVFTVIVTIEVQQESQMSFIIPRTTYDSILNGIISKAVLLEDGKEIFPEVILNPEIRIFNFDVKEGSTELEFILTQTPESDITFLERDPTGVFSEIPYPREQIEMGVSPSEVSCNANLKLLLKSTDNSPACVQLLTAQKLIERGWAKSE